jgi:tRNA threonylcarbamoyladenosine biosynthesis protein TsaE
MIHRIVSNEKELREFAAAFARRLKPGDTVALSGPLGSGKTTFVRAVVEALHHVDQTSSPTFTFWHRYEGRPPIDHVDLFRVDDPKEIAELGLEDAFGDDSIALVEWWRNAPSLVPVRRYEIDLEGAGDEPRTIVVKEPA